MGLQFLIPAITLQFGLNIWWLIFRKKILTGNTDGCLWSKSRLCSCHNELSELSTSCVSTNGTMAHGASVSAPWGRTYREPGIEMLEDTFHPDSVSSSRSSFEWRVSLCSVGATLLNYNWNLLKHWVFFFKRPFICIHQHSLKWRKIWITKAESAIYFQRSFWVDCWVGSPYVMTCDRKFWISNTTFNWSALQIMLCNFPKSLTFFNSTSTFPW